MDGKTQLLFFNLHFLVEINYRQSKFIGLFLYDILISLLVFHSKLKIKNLKLVSNRQDEATCHS